MSNSSVTLKVFVAEVTPLHHMLSMGKATVWNKLDGKSNKSPRLTHKWNRY